MVALSVLVLAPGLAGCGSSRSAGSTGKADAALARQHWRAGLLRWHTATQHALNGISVIFSTQASLARLGRSTSRASTRLVSLEAVLVRCERTVHALGPVPPGFELAGSYALRACDSLEQGEHGLEVLVDKLRRGQGVYSLDPLKGAGDLLSLGQAQLTTALHALDNPSE